MRNNIQNDVKVENARNYKSKFDLSGSISNTLSIGRVGVAFSRELRPKTKAMCGSEQLLWLNALVRPVYAKQKYKNWHMFVPIADVFPNYDAMMAREPINRNGAIFTPSAAPSLPTSCLSAICLNGSRCSLYLREIGSASDPIPTDLAEQLSSSTFAIARYNPADANDNYRKAVDAALQGIWSKRSDGSPIIDIGTLLHLPAFWDNTWSFDLESGNIDKVSFGKYDGLEEDQYFATLGGYDHKNVVSLDKADFVVYTVHSDNTLNKTYSCAWAFRLSSWGQSFYKNLRALGYDVNLDDDTPCSLVPLIAAYKAYWDIFGLNMWQNWETTAAARLIEIYTNWSTSNFDVWSNNNTAGWNAFKSFIFDEFGAMWLTEKNDFVSAHLPQPTISPEATQSVLSVGSLLGISDVKGFSGQSIDSNSDTRGYNSLQPSYSHADGHAKTKDINHGALDSELLKRLYKWTNRNTVLGRKIADLMRAQGLGMYMERTRVNYIGDTEVPLDVKRVTSQSDTFNEATGEGAVLGQYAGNGVGYKPNQKKLFYETDCEGFWICLDAVTCDSGYSQANDISTRATNPDMFYRPDFDALGLEQNSKTILNGSKFTSLRKICLGSGENLDKFVASMSPFGFAPRYSRWKIGRSCLNGGFSLRSTRDVYLPFNMDKVLFPEDAVSRPMGSQYWDSTHFPSSWSSDDAGEIHYLHRTLPITDVPIAGNSWRFLNRFPWLSNLNRIFVAFGAERGALTWSNQNLGALAKYFEYHYLSDDNYVLLNDVWFKAWCGMLPIEETYGTIDPDKKELEYVEKV